ncbi:MAG: orotidine-5'-phosphate decarboxylase [Actinobacteria bacterium]|nr:orotidine-5'-phosphate decarboxylase [Actinomycetota bacterium]
MRSPVPVRSLLDLAVRHGFVPLGDPAAFVDNGRMGDIEPPVAPFAPFADRLADAVERKGSQLVVGLDPVVDLLPIELRGESVHGRSLAAAAVERFCVGIVDSVAPHVVAIKPQVAFFEALGADGWGALERVCRHCRDAGLLVIADAKRGDIGSTARAYATAFLEPGAAGVPLADALTVNPYLGQDSLDPYLAACRRHGAGLFVLVRTSNAGAADIQDAALSDGRPLWRHVADLVRTWGEDIVGECGLSSVGAVVGATVPRFIGDARRAMPQSVILLPGVGAQGATPADVARAFTSGPASAVVNVSRSVIYAYREQEDADWRSAAGAEAARLAAEIRAASGW